MKMKVLFIGGTGIISSASSELAVSRGIDLYHLNRGRTDSIRHIDGVKLIKADIRNEKESEAALAEHHFDAVVDWIAFTPEHINQDIRLFTGKTDQLVFISSASIYQTPPQTWPATENTPLDNPVWEYSQNKIACEDVLREANRKTGFPCTIVRPSHTYDKTLVPLEWEHTMLYRMKKGKPIIVHGDGSSLWTLTNHRDFAVGLVGLLGKLEAIGEAYHITSDEWLSWGRIVHILAGHLGVEPKIVHVPSEVIARYDKTAGDSLLGDKTHSMVFDNSKIKALVPDFEAKVPFEVGAKEIVDWFEEDISRQIPDSAADELMDRIIADWDRT